MNRKADVICQHTSDGEIIPIKIRFADEDGEFHTYAIRAYRIVTKNGDILLPNEVTAKSHIWIFECRIVVFEKEISVRLFYNAHENMWKIVK